MDERHGRQAAGKLIRASIADARMRGRPAKIHRGNQLTRRDSRNSRIVAGRIRANAFGPLDDARALIARNSPSPIKWERWELLHDQARCSSGVRIGRGGIMLR